MKRLQELEGHQEQVKQELEKNIQSLKAMIAKYDMDYSKNMEILTAISDPLMGLLKNVSRTIYTICCILLSHAM